MSSSYNKSRDGISSSTNKIMTKRVSFFMFVSMFILVLLAYTRTFGSHIAAYDQHAISAPSSSAFNGNKHACYPKIGLRPLKSRDEIGTLLQEHGFKTGVEVGVKKGEFAKQILDKWSSCVSYTLVDLWDKQENYKDIANVASQVHEEYYKETLSRLELYKNKIQVYRMYSTEAAKKMVPNSLDFAYIDARHDYCGVMDDLKAYWPLIKPGGIMAGHDYNENSEIRGQDWGLCQDGTRNEMAVKGAVNDFFLPQGLTITVTYYREHNFMSWLVQKPLC